MSMMPKAVAYAQLMAWLQAEREPQIEGLSVAESLDAIFVSGYTGPMLVHFTEGRLRALEPFQARTWKLES